MMRSWIGKHYPHILLTASSAACLTIVLASPDRGHAPRYVWPDQKQADHASHNDTTIQKKQTPVRSLAEILQQARVRLEQLQRDQAHPQDKPNDAQTHLTTASEDASQHQTARRRSMTFLPKANNPFAGPMPQYANVSDLLAWRAPDALLAREYVVLAFGEVGQ